MTMLTIFMAKQDVVLANMGYTHTPVLEVVAATNQFNKLCINKSIYIDLFSKLFEEVYLLGGPPQGWGWPTATPPSPKLSSFVIRSCYKLAFDFFFFTY